MNESNDLLIQRKYNFFLIQVIIGQHVFKVEKGDRKREDNKLALKLSFSLNKVILILVSNTYLY